jgi:hypothetical protein
MGGPLNRIQQQALVIVRHHVPVHPVEIPRKIDHPSRAHFVHEDVRYVGLLYRPEGLLHRKIRNRGNPRERLPRTFGVRFDVQLPGASDQRVGIFHAAQQRGVEWASLLRIQIRVLQRRPCIHARDERSPKEIGKAEVFPQLAMLVAK